jgi:hypothetical protein
MLEMRDRLETQLEIADVDPHLPNAPRKIIRNAPKTEGDNKKGQDKIKEEEFWSVRDAELYFRSMELGIMDGTLATPEMTRMAEKKLGNKPLTWQRRPERFLKWLEKRVKARKTLPETLEIAKWLSTQQLAEAAVAKWYWREIVRDHLKRFDQAHSFVQMYRSVYEQIKSEGTLPDRVLIRSDFYRTINRRYQPTHMWPSYVSNKDVNENYIRVVMQSEDQPSDHEIEDHLDEVTEGEGPEKTYRKSWFQAQHPTTEEPCDLVGIDVSSSQTQIVAAFLSSATLELETMRQRTDVEGAADIEKSVPFKESLARIAWARHSDPDDEFKLKKVQWPNPKLANYSGPDDTCLQNLCKALWMTISYGGTIRGVVRAQENDPDTYGPGWTPHSASLFLESINDRYPSMQAFLSVCRGIAKAIAADEKLKNDGFVFTDPFDHSENHWNPAERQDDYLDIGKGKIALSLPRGMKIENRFKEDAKYPVDEGALRRMLAPCLVHTLDAYYSSLVMKGLVKRGITTFVAIHDCWLVPHVVLDKGRERDGVEVIGEVFDAAAAEWYRGLRPAYEAFLGYLPEPSLDGKKDRTLRRHRKLIAEAFDHWKQRRRGGYIPRFLFKRD